MLATVMPVTLAGVMARDAGYGQLQLSVNSCQHNLSVHMTRYYLTISKLMNSNEAVCDQQAGNVMVVRLSREKGSCKAIRYAAHLGSWTREHSGILSVNSYQ